MRPVSQMVYEDGVPDERAWLSLDDGLRVLDARASTQQRTVSPGLPGADVFVRPGDLLERSFSGSSALDSLFVSRWAGRRGAAGRNGAGGTSVVSHPLFSSNNAAGVQVKRGDGSARTAGPAGQYQGIKRTAEQDKKIRTEAMFADAEQEPIGKKPALTPGGKAVVGASKGVHTRFDSESASRQHALSEQQRRTQSQAAAAGISSDMPQGPGASASSLFNVKDPGDNTSRLTDDFDVTAQKGTDAIAQAGRSAAGQLAPGAKSDFDARRQAEDRSKRMQQQGGSGSSEAPPATKPGLNTIRSGSTSEPDPEPASSSGITSSVTSAAPAAKRLASSSPTSAASGGIHSRAAELFRAWRPVDSPGASVAASSSIEDSNEIRDSAWRLSSSPPRVSWSADAAASFAEASGNREWAASDYDGPSRTDTIVASGGSPRRAMHLGFGGDEAAWAAGGGATMAHAATPGLYELKRRGIRSGPMQLGAQPPRSVWTVEAAAALAREVDGRTWSSAAVTPPAAAGRFQSYSGSGASGGSAARGASQFRLGGTPASAGGGIDIGSFGGQAVGSQTRHGGASPGARTSPRDFSASALGTSDFEGQLAEAGGMKRPGRRGADFPASGILIGAFSEVHRREVHPVLAPDPDYVHESKQLHGAAVKAAREILQDIHNALVSRGDPSKYHARLNRSVKQFIKRAALAIYLSQLKKWKDDGKAGPRPNKDDIEQGLSDLFDEAAESDPKDPAPPPQGPLTPPGAKRCAEEKEACEAECEKPCTCVEISDAGGGTTDPWTSTLTVRGNRPDLELEAVLTPGPWQPGAGAESLTVADPADDLAEITMLGEGVYAQIPIERLGSRLRWLQEKRDGTTSTNKQEKLDKKIKRLEERIEERLLDLKDEFIQAQWDLWWADLKDRGWSDGKIRQFLVSNMPRFQALFQLSLARQMLLKQIESAPEKYKRGLNIKLAETDLSAGLIEFELRSGAGIAKASEVVGLLRFANLLDGESVDFHGGDESMRQWVGVLAQHPLIRETLDQIDPSFTSAVAARVRDADILDLTIFGAYRNLVAAKDLADRWLNSEERLAAGGVTQEDIDEVQALLRGADVARSIETVENAMVDLYEWGEDRSALEIGAYVGGAIALGVLTAGVGYGVAAAAGGGVLGAMTGAAAAGMLGGALESVLTQSIAHGGFDPEKLDWDLVSRDAAIGGVFGAVTGPFSSTLRGASVAGFREAIRNRAHAAASALRNPVAYARKKLHPGHGESGFASIGGGPKGDFSRLSEVQEELLGAARSEKFRARALAAGFSEVDLRQLERRIPQMMTGDLPAGGWSDEFSILVGKRGIITPTREGRLFHELGHVLDDTANPGTFFRSTADPDFGFMAYREAEYVAYQLQYGAGSWRARGASYVSAAYQLHPIKATVAFTGTGYYGLSESGKAVMDQIWPE